MCNKTYYASFTFFANVIYNENFLTSYTNMFLYFLIIYKISVYFNVYCKTFFYFSFFKKKGYI